ncbi:hypothetical protein ACFWBB_26605 [Streptomyces sp. NPDC060000]|uniref:hypothetical protein n=1 Tax=Streptomyces sp. NPDC060000 TaxID=3347031 RepID=UPI0036BE5F66
MTTTSTPVRTDRVIQLCARIRLEGGVWNGARTLAFYEANGFDCDLGRARANLDMAAEQFPQLLERVEEQRWTYRVSPMANTYFPEGALEAIADGRAFIAFAREKLIGAARTLPNDSGERQLLSGMKRILDDYEARHESAALSHSLDDDTGHVFGMRWSLESLLWARFSGTPDEYPVEWRP